MAPRPGRVRLDRLAARRRREAGASTRAAHFLAALPDLPRSRRARQWSGGALDEPAAARFHVRAIQIRLDATGGPGGRRRPVPHRSRRPAGERDAVLRRSAERGGAARRRGVPALSRPARRARRAPSRSAARARERRQRRARQDPLRPELRSLSRRRRPRAEPLRRPERPASGGARPQRALDVPRRQRAGADLAASAHWHGRTPTSSRAT